MTTKRNTTFGLGTALLLGMVTAPAVFASNAIAHREGDLACTRCHDKPGSRLLTDFGKYYELMGSTVGYTELKDRFARCTDCHVKKPGSTKLTKVGERYQWMMGDMEGIRAWLMEKHPAANREGTNGAEANGETGSAPGAGSPMWPAATGAVRGMVSASGGVGAASRIPRVPRTQLPER